MLHQAASAAGVPRHASLQPESPRTSRRPAKAVLSRWHQCRRASALEQSMAGGKSQFFSIPLGSLAPPLGSCRSKGEKGEADLRKGHEVIYLGRPDPALVSRTLSLFDVAFYNSRHFAFNLFDTATLLLYLTIISSSLLRRLPSCSSCSIESWQRIKDVRLHIKSQASNHLVPVRLFNLISHHFTSLSYSSPAISKTRIDT